MMYFDTEINHTFQSYTFYLVFEFFITFHFNIFDQYFDKNKRESLIHQPHIQIKNNLVIVLRSFLCISCNYRCFTSPNVLNFMYMNLPRNASKTRRILTTERVCYQDKLQTTFVYTSDKIVTFWQAL